MSALVHRERPAAGEPDGLLVLHHGRGADEHDLLGLADVLDPERRLHVVTPRAPLVIPGWPGYHWYVVPAGGLPRPGDLPRRVHGARRVPRRALGAHRPDARTDRPGRVLDGLGDELLARAGRRPAARLPASSRSPGSFRRSRAGSRTWPIARPPAPSSPTAAPTRSWTSIRPPRPPAARGRRTRRRLPRVRRRPHDRPRAPPGGRGLALERDTRAA